MYATLENNNPGIIAENTVNGVIENTEIIIINDTNFYDYFDEEGYLKYNFKANSQRILFITFLSNKNLYFTDSITLTSNKQANLLFNVTITTIKDFKFYSFDKESIILDGVENVVINGNEFTSLTSNIFEIKTISASGGCRLCNITDNSIFMNSNANYTYAILVSEPQHVIKKKFSQNFTISNNNILIKSSGVAEAMYFDALVSSDIADNNINIKSEGSAYGIAICNVMGRPYDVNIKSNKIIVSSKEMSYLIELFRVDKCLILNNYLKATSNGVYGIGVYDSGSTINGNEMIVVGRNLTSNSPADALGKGNSVFYITRQSQIDEFKNNIIDSQNCEIITNIDSNIENDLIALFSDVGALIEKAELKLAISEIFSCIRKINKYFDAEKPWSTIKEDKKVCAVTIYNCINAIKSFAILLNPFVPFSSKKISNNISSEINFISTK